MPEMLTIEGKQVSAQQVTVTTKNMALDVLGIKVWLATDDARIPLRFSLGQYQAELISPQIVAK